MAQVKVAAVIPARMASRRFPGKPLIKIRGLPMVEHVRRRAQMCRRFSEVVVATCDREIAQVIQAMGGTVVMTSPEHPAAADRVAEAAAQLDCTHLVNVQGDEILILPDDLERMVMAIESEPTVPVWNAVAPVEASSELSDSSVVKCLVSVSGRILFCCRDLSALSGVSWSQGNPIRRVLGVSGYRKDFLERYVRLPRTPFEVAESLDQSRILEHDVLLRSVPFPKGYLGINEHKEVEVVHSYLEEDPRQREVLRELKAQ